jgi:hypothetical protein
MEKYQHLTIRCRGAGIHLSASAFLTSKGGDTFICNCFDSAPLSIPVDDHDLSSFGTGQLPQMLYNQIDVLLLTENGDYNRELVSTLWPNIESGLVCQLRIHLSWLYSKPAAWGIVPVP